MKFARLDSLLPPITDALGKEKTCLFRPLPFAAATLLALEMKRGFKRPVVLITESVLFMDEMRRNLEAFTEENSSLFDYPPFENFSGTRRDIADAITEGTRLRTLAHISNTSRPFLINTCLQALLQKIFPPSTLTTISLTLATGREYAPEHLTTWLEKSGYDLLNEVQEPGQAARRGGLIDVWPPSEAYPLRIEFDGPTIESIRSFYPIDQRSFAKKQDIILLPATETVYLPIQNQPPADSLARYLPPETIFFWAEKCLPESGKGGRQYSGFAYHADLFEKAAADNKAKEQITSFQELVEMILKGRQAACLSVLEPFLRTNSPALDLGFQRLDEIEFSIKSFLTPDIAEEKRRHWLTMLDVKARRGIKVHLFFSTQGAFDRFRNAFGKYPFKLHLGEITDGFLHEELNLGVVSEAKLFQADLSAQRKSEIKAHKPETRRPLPADSITDWTNIEPGDLVVHAQHGIGKYLGLYEIVFNGKLQETFAIEYANQAKLYVPMSQASLISRYFTAGRRKSKSHRLGGNQWNREKQAAQKAIYAIASSLLETQALRQSLPGFAYPHDAPWQHDFEAAFPYEETEDQEKAIQEVKSDMQSPAPMDRLICGDAGYGKTEVAVRAAFKAVMAGKQVAVLVPTTVLALQHYEVFQQRMADYPIRVELLCRLRPESEQNGIVRELRNGTVDIVIGTHRLLQPDLAFKDLGLIIIDEEQRFGVTHKEHLKHLKKLADVLTLTATPIPRTLYMSLTGARKISMVQTPPKSRLPVETIIAKNDDRLVREAILRELNRGGQVFYLHNRIATIDKINVRLQTIVPEAKIAVAHGQLPSRELAETMHAFSRGMFDVLLCTTIVESGVDLPNVNTILIDRADRFGIADLYQLRGRVGRSDRKAYAYLLTPVHGYLLDVSRCRLGAIIEHSKMGSGFKLAMLDLEIRGAGNLLGAEQSGHIAAIGFDLYCQMLHRAIEFLKNSGLPHGTKPPHPVPTPQRSAHPSSPRRSLGEGGEVKMIPSKGGAGVGWPAQVFRTETELNLDFIDLSVKSNTPESAAFLPGDYIEDEELRIKIYRKIAAAVNREGIELLRNEFRDRFGPIPTPFERFLQMAVIRVIAREKGISTVETKGNSIRLRRGNEYFKSKNHFPQLRARDADDKLKEIIEYLHQLQKIGAGGGS